MVRPPPAPGYGAVSPKALKAQRTARLNEWTVPARLGGEKAEVRGLVEYRPLLGAVVPELRSPVALTPELEVTRSPAPSHGA